MKKKDPNHPVRRAWREFSLCMAHDLAGVGAMMGTFAGMIGGGCAAAAAEAVGISGSLGGMLVAGTMVGALGGARVVAGAALSLSTPDSHSFPNSRRLAGAKGDIDRVRLTQKLITSMTEHYADQPELPAATQKRVNILVADAAPAIARLHSFKNDIKQDDFCFTRAVLNARGQLVTEDLSPIPAMPATAPVARVADPDYAAGQREVESLLRSDRLRVASAFDARRARSRVDEDVEEDYIPPSQRKLSR